LAPVWPIREIADVAGEPDDRLAALHRAWADAAGRRLPSEMDLRLGEQQAGSPTRRPGTGPGVDWALMDALTEWIDLVDARIQLMLEETVRFVTDESADSLTALQGVLESLDDEEWLGAAAYLGVSLLAAAGGGEWGWDEESDQPIVVPHPALGLAPVFPIKEIEVRNRVIVVSDGVEWWRYLHRDPDADGDRLAAMHRAWAEAAGPRPPSELDLWLAGQEAGFPAWVQTYGPRVDWDFSVGSLDRLEEVLRRIVVSATDLTDDGHRHFSDGASWYLGEVLRRTLGGLWDRVVEDNQLRKLGPGHATITPLIALKRAVTEPEYLRKFYSMYS
jgi:hypothetical protein